MGHLFNNNLTIKKKHKLLYFSPKVWRLVALANADPVYKNAEKKIYCRGSNIPISYLFRDLLIHNGNKFKKYYPSRWAIGFKFGCFTWNRKYALYKSKKKKKK